MCGFCANTVPFFRRGLERLDLVSARVWEAVPCRCQWLPVHLTAFLSSLANIHHSPQNPAQTTFFPKPLTNLIATKLLCLLSNYHSVAVPPVYLVPPAPGRLCVLLSTLQSDFSPLVAGTLSYAPLQENQSRIYTFWLVCYFAVISSPSGLQHCCKAWCWGWPVSRVWIALRDPFWMQGKEVKWMTGLPRCQWATPWALGRK